MSFTKRTLKLQGMFTFEGKTEVIEHEGKIYAPIIEFIGGGEMEETNSTNKPEKPKKSTSKPEKPAAEEVVDDTASTLSKDSFKGMPVKNNVASEPTELKQEDLELDQKVQVELNDPKFKGKLYSGQVVKIEGSKIFVKFDEDGETDFLRPADRVFSFNFKF